MQESEGKRRAVFAAAVVGVVIPIILAILAAGLMFVWHHELPDPVATHWGISDRPNGFTPIALFTIEMSLIIALTPLILTLPILLSAKKNWGPSYRFLPAISLATAVMLFGVMSGSIAIQRGLSDAHDAPGIGMVLLWSTLAAAFMGFLGFILQPKHSDAKTQVAFDADGIDASDAAGSWHGVARMTTAGVVLIWVAVAVVIATLALIKIAPPPEEVPPLWVDAMMFATGLSMILAALTMVRFNVTIDEEKFQVTSVVGWPQTTVAIADIEDVNVTVVNPMGEFGGWGYRVGFDGRSGYLLDSGEALEIKSSKRKRVLVVTVPEASEAARVLRANLKAQRPD